ncbi:MAG: phosphoglucomutase/phosphomannomutase family protein [Deltaproteobacteria bacterium]|nr:phosphoglucomutase/phosphomannomutase family protein [Deltaproteobacteria bacterium]
MIKFGTDGWRAIIEEEFTEENVDRVTLAFAKFMKETSRPSGKIYVGFDRRRKSDLMAKRAASLLASQGYQVFLASSFCPTPCVSWNTKADRAIAGMMITASHNPPQWNGIKFKEEDGGAASPEYTTEIEKIIEQNDKNPTIPSTSRGGERGFDPHHEYVLALQKQVNLKRIQKTGWKIGYDPLYGAGTHYLPQILETDLVEIHTEADPNFGGLNPEPIEKNLSALIQLVKKRGLDAGFSTDGDADRVGAVDENGNFVDSHHIYALILRHLLSAGKERGEIIKTVSTSNMIDLLAKKHGRKFYELPIGFKHICKKFREVPAFIGGEESGGIAVRSWLNERDGLFSSLYLLEIMAYHQKRLGELIEDLHQELGPHYFQRLDLHLAPDVVTKARSKLSRSKIDSIAGKKIVKTNFIDGFKYHLSDASWLLIRPSGTEPVLRIYAEAPEPAGVTKLLEAGQALVD